MTAVSLCLHMHEDAVDRGVRAVWSTVTALGSCPVGQQWYEVRRCAACAAVREVVLRYTIGAQRG